MDRTRAIWLIACTWLLVGCARAAPGEAQLVEVTTAELAQAAQAIVRGNVTAIRSEWNEGRTYIWSFVTIDVSDALRGPNAGEAIEVMIPGGVVGEIAQTSSDQVTFAQGEDVIVFLGQETYQGADYYNVVRLVQGKFSVVDSRVRAVTMDEAPQVDADEFWAEISRLIG